MRIELQWLPCPPSPWRPWLPPMVASMLAISMAACTSAAPPPASPGRDFAQYRTLPHYRAFAVTGGTLDGGDNYASGWSLEKTSVEAAVDEALSECNRFRDASSQPSCQLYAIGDLVVAGMDPAQLPRAQCVYLLGAAHTRVADPNAAGCAALLLASLVPAAAAAGEPTAVNPLMATASAPATNPLAAAQLEQAASLRPEQPVTAPSPPPSPLKQTAAQPGPGEPHSMPVPPPAPSAPKPEPSPALAAPKPLAPRAPARAPDPVVAAPEPPSPRSPEPEAHPITAAPALPAIERAEPQPKPTAPRSTAAPQPLAASTPKPEPSPALAALVPKAPAPEQATPKPAPVAPVADAGALRRALAAIKAQMDARAGAPPDMPPLQDPPRKASAQP